MKTQISFISLLALSLFTAPVVSQITLVPFVNNVNAVTDITNCGDDRLFIVEQVGKIRIADLQGNLLPAPYLSITGRVASGGERGLLGLAFSPNYQSDGRFYVNYTNLSGNTVISRFTVSANPDEADSLNEEILFSVVQPYSNHNGGAMFFGNDGYLYISLGDGGSGGDPGNRAQNIMEDLGKLLRIDVNVPSGYSIPGSNPFYGNPSANPRIWAYGLRNAWRVNKDRLTGDIWIADVGQGSWEEINYQPFSSTGGENYGWRCYEGNAPHNTTGCQPQPTYDSPVYVLGHPPACSITGGFVYRGAQYAVHFGRYFFTDYCDDTIRSLEPDGSGGFTEVLHGSFTGPFVTFGEDKYGELYIGRNSTGVVKLTDASCQPVAFISNQDTINHCGDTYLLTTPAAPGFLYQWYFNSTAITGANSDTLTVTQSGTYTVETVNAAFCTNTSDPVYLNIIPAPQVSLSGLPSVMCVYHPSVALTGNPAGGVFSGAGVSGSTFDPAIAGAGTHIVTYSFDNGNGCVINSSVSVFVDECVGLPEHPLKNGFIIQPNPANDYTEIVFGDGVKNISKIEIFDVSGRLSLSRKIENETSVLLNTGKFTDGVYIVAVTAGDRTYRQKLVIQ